MAAPKNDRLRGSIVMVALWVVVMVVVQHYDCRRGIVCCSLPPRIRPVFALVPFSLKFAFGRQTRLDFGTHFPLRRPKESATSVSEIEETMLLLVYSPPL
jgi:hypothetical protein